MLKFGMPSMIELDTVEASVELCGQLGLDFVELNTNFPKHQPHLLDADVLKRLTKENGIFYTIHLNDELNVAEFNPHVAKGYRDSVLETIDFAKSISAPVLNMHLSNGAYYTMPDRRIHFYEAYREEYLEGMRTFRDACEQAIGDSRIRICVENTAGYQPFHLAALELLLESPVFGLTLDIGHNCCAGFVDEQWIVDHADRLRHMHMHDVRNGKKDHLALGDGELDLEKYHAMATEHNCTVVVEVKTIAGLRESVEWMKNREYISKEKH